MAQPLLESKLALSSKAEAAHVPQPSCLFLSGKVPRDALGHVSRDMAALVEIATQ